jgi:hypothetical protein
MLILTEFPKLHSFIALRSFRTRFCAKNCPVRSLSYTGNRFAALQATPSAQGTGPTEKSALSVRYEHEKLAALKYCVEQNADDLAAELRAIPGNTLGNIGPGAKEKQKGAGAIDSRKPQSAKHYDKRRARDSNPQPLAGQLISNQSASHSLTLLGCH